MNDRQIIKSIEDKLQACDMELDEWRVWNNMRFVYEKTLPPTLDEIEEHANQEEF